VLGAGGAAAAAVLALSRSGVTTIRLVARREAAVGEMARVMGLTARVGELVWVPWEMTWVHAALASISGQLLLVNATPLALADLPVDVARLPAACTVVDLRYRPRPVDLVAAASARGLRAADGVEMLLHQGMLSFQRWTGVEPPWDAARAALQGAVAGAQA
jgi:shikimate dehydrogenase